MKKLKELWKSSDSEHLFFILTGVASVVGILWLAFSDGRSIEPKVVSETTYGTSSVIQPVFTSLEENSEDWGYLISGLEEVTSGNVSNIVTSFDVAIENISDLIFHLKGSPSDLYISLFSGNSELVKRKKYLSDFFVDVPFRGNLILYNTETRTYSVIEISESNFESNLDEYTKMYKRDYASYVGLPSPEVECSVFMVVSTMDDGSKELTYKEVYSLTNKEELDSFIKNSPKKEDN